MQPREVRLSKDRSSIALIYEHEVRTIAADTLWHQSRAADSLAATQAGTRGELPAGLLISTIQLIGRYGLNIAFSDGYGRGIYPWEYLDALSIEQSGKPNTCDHPGADVKQ
ncbi:MAG: DUF971 domain-containing protein [Rhodomicrobium sp.]|nr:DUF971 domain-containing protein [Rhodomicrobium sp.]